MFFQQVAKKLNEFFRVLWEVFENYERESIENTTKNAQVCYRLEVPNREI